MTCIWYSKLHFLKYAWCLHCKFIFGPTRFHVLYQSYLGTHLISTPLSTSMKKHYPAPCWGMKSRSIDVQWIILQKNISKTLRSNGFIRSPFHCWQSSVEFPSKRASLKALVVIFALFFFFYHFLLHLLFTYLPLPLLLCKVFLDEYISSLTSEYLKRD